MNEPSQDGWYVLLRGFSGAKGPHSTKETAIRSARAFRGWRRGADAIARLAGGIWYDYSPVRSAAKGLVP